MKTKGLITLFALTLFISACGGSGGGHRSEATPGAGTDTGTGSGPSTSVMFSTLVDDMIASTADNVDPVEINDKELANDADDNEMAFDKHL